MKLQTEDVNAEVSERQTGAPSLCFLRNHLSHLSSGDLAVSSCALGSPVELLILCFLCPLVHIGGLLYGVKSYWLQPRIYGIGLWGAAINFVLLLLFVLLWLRLL